MTPKRQSATTALRRRVAPILEALVSTAPLHTPILLGLLLLLILTFVPLQQNADGLLLTIMSLQKLTLFFWEQDRFANLGPLLTAGITDPTANAYAQLGLRIVCGLLAPLFFTAQIFRSPSDIWRATTLASLLLAIGGGRWLTHEFFIEASPYGMSFATAGLAGLILRAPRKIPATAAAALLLITAYTLNFGLITIALPLIGLMALLLPTRERMRLAVLHAAAAAIGQILPAIAAPDFRTPMSTSLTLGALTEFLRKIAEGTDLIWALTVILTTTLATAVILWKRPALRRQALPIVAILLTVAALNITAIAASRWVAMNGFNLRYFIPAHVLLMSLSGCALTTAIRVLAKSQAIRTAGFLTLSTALLLTAQNRLTRQRNAERDIVIAAEAPIAHAIATQALRFKLDAIAGSHWEVWPAIFMATQYRQDAQILGPQILGIALHGGTMRRQFAANLAASGKLRIACIDLDPAPCAASTAQIMRTTPLKFAELAPAETLPEGHRISFIEITPAI
eukprot:gene1937-1969_t